MVKSKQNYTNIINGRSPYLGKKYNNKKRVFTVRNYPRPKGCSV